MNLAAFAIRQRTFIAFFTCLCVLAGIDSYFKLGKLEDPTFTVKSAVVITLYPGASAKEVEQQVTDKVETKLQEMGSLWKLRSLSRPGMSYVFVDLKENLNSKELPQQWDLLRRKVNDVKLTLPSTAQLSLVQDEFSEVYGMVFSIYGDGVENAQLRLYAKELQRRLKTVDGIKKIELHGVRQQVVNIDIPDERMSESGISPIQVFDQLSSQNMTYDAGQFRADIERIRVDQASGFTSVDDIKNLSIKGGVGNFGSGVVRLGDVADVSMGYKQPDLTLSRYNGYDAVTLAVSPVDGINVVSLGDALKKVIAQYQQELPVGVEIGTVAFQPDLVTDSINNFVLNLAESCAIVVLVLWLFMGWKSASIVGASLMMSILLTLIYMLIDGVALQRVSLGTFILALGMLVDNAIVITDMMQVKLNQGIERTQAAVESVKEMGVPLLGATVIAIMGALPVLFMVTSAGEFSLSTWQIMSSSLLFSWLVAMMLTPLMCWWWLKPAAKDAEAAGSAGEAKSTWLQRGIHWTVANPLKTLALLLPLLAATAVGIPFIKINFLPTSDRALVFLDYWLPNGSQVEQTASDMQQIETWLMAQPEVEDIASFVGASAPRFSVTVEPEPLDPSYGQIVINVKDYAAIAALQARGDVWLQKKFPHAEPRFRGMKLATADKYNLEARFTGPDPVVLHRLADQAKAIYAAHPNTRYVRDDWRQPSKVLSPVVNQEQARRAGVNRSDISLAIKRASEGVTLSHMRLGDELIPIQLRSADSDLSKLETLPVRSVAGLHSVPLGQVVDEFVLSTEESMIWRRNRVPTITAQADVFGAANSEVFNQVKPAIERIELPQGYSMEWGGEHYDEERGVRDLLSNLPKSGIVSLLIMVALFNGFKQPLIILVTLPLAATGSTLALLLADKPFGFMALTGAICLAGMIIKNGIVLMDQIELERRNGRALDEAICEATENRTMAISMGALTTALGMIPLLSDPLFDQMAATIIGGLCAATVLSLCVMPALYKLVYRNQAVEADNTQHIDSKELAHEAV